MPRLVPANEDSFRQLWIVRKFADPKRVWVTYRWPWQSSATITHPEGMGPVTARFHWVYDHEMHHVRQFETWWGPWVIPLAHVLFPFPFIFSGRWFIERGAYLWEIRGGHRSVDQVVDKLWKSYLWPWPKPLMRKWYESQLKEESGDD